MSPLVNRTAGRSTIELPEKSLPSIRAQRRPRWSLDAEARLG